MKLIQQTVYITNNEASLPLDRFEGIAEYVTELPNVFVFTKEELTELLDNTFKAGSDRNYHVNNQDDQNGTRSPNFGQYLSQLID